MFTPPLTYGIVAPQLPYGYVLEILFAAILAASLVLAFKYPSFRRRWMLLLFAVGAAEFEFASHVPAPYNNLIVGMVIGLVTAFIGIVVPVSYFARQHLRKK